MLRECQYKCEGIVRRGWLQVSNHRQDYSQRNKCHGDGNDESNTGVADSQDKAISRHRDWQWEKVDGNELENKKQDLFLKSQQTKQSDTQFWPYSHRKTN